MKKYVFKEFESLLQITGLQNKNGLVYYASKIEFMVRQSFYLTVNVPIFKPIVYQLTCPFYIASVSC